MMKDLVPDYVETNGSPDFAAAYSNFRDQAWLMAEENWDDCSCQLRCEIVIDCRHAIHVGGCTVRQGSCKVASCMKAALQRY